MNTKLDTTKTTELLRGWKRLCFRTRLKNLGLLDWTVLAIGLVAICTATYLQTLRHP